MTGSIGQNTLRILRDYKKSNSFSIVAFSAHNNIKLLARSAIEFNAKFAITSNLENYDDLKKELTGTKVQALAGSKSISDCAEYGVDWTMNAIIGSAGLEASINTAKFGKTLALANKESLVCAGDLLMGLYNESEKKLIPVDSEHSAIFQCLNGENVSEIDKVTLTASGGPFRHWSTEEMKVATLQQALAHPNWEMGDRISIDSATMFNKALELLEAKYLFDLPSGQIDVLVHPESIVHSMVSFKDNSTIAQLSVPDMCGAIGYALNYPNREVLPMEKLDLTKVQKLTFYKPDFVRFPALRLAYNIMGKGGLLGAVFNAAKEVALDRFVSGSIGFLQIAQLVESVMESTSINSIEHKKADNITDILAADELARNIAIKKQLTNF